MDAFTLFRNLSLALALLTTVCFFYQILYLFIPLLKKEKKLKEHKPLRYAVLIAARNEEAVLPHLLDSINAQDYPKELVTTFVAADNCTDGTADAAAAHGAVVYPRFNKKEVGKGYAIHYLIDRIRSDFGLEQFDAFLIFDADNLLEPDYISKINVLPSAGFHAFCGYRNTKNFGTNWISSGYGLWYQHESTHMNRSRMLLGCGCCVNGTGFGFTKELLEKLGNWNFFTLTEDIEFNNWCATHGVKIGYCHDAVLYDEQPITFRTSWKQRIRWAQGGFQVSFRYGAKLLKGLFRGGWAGYSCFELATLSLWGYLLAVLTGIFSAVLSFLSAGLVGGIAALATALIGTYGSMFAMGAWTLLLEWNRIKATPGQKIASVFTFPFYMMTYVPIGLAAIFHKFEWLPIEHTVAISASELIQK